MKNNPRLLLSIFALILVFGGAWAALNLTSSEPMLGPKTPTPPSGGTPSSSEPAPPSTPDPVPVEEAFAPDFSMTDAEGNTVMLSDFRGKPVILNFWASWCGPCQIEMPHFDAVYTEQGETVTVLMVNLEDTKTAQGFMDKHGYSFPFYVDSNKEGSTAYSVVSIPRTYSIDAEGNLVESFIGSMNERLLSKMVDNLLGS